MTFRSACFAPDANNPLGRGGEPSLPPCLAPHVHLSQDANGSSCFLACILSVPMETSPTPPVGSKAPFSPAPAHPLQRASLGRAQKAGVPCTPGGAHGSLCPAPTLQHYSKDKGAICTKLVKPKRKQGTKSAEEELAKAGWLLNLQHLTLGARIGEGEFGAVLQGEYLGQKVAVKNIKCDVTAQAFLDETAVMTKMQHKNLVRLLGVILHQGLYIVMEHVSKVHLPPPQGNLVNFLRTRGRALVSTPQLLQFSLHVAEGMEYLESKKLVHRDLAARNILISEDLVAKVSDFGLAKAERKGLDSSRLPVKWTAPEALKHGKFSSKSDVWSFGVLLWEVFSYGRAPYPKMSLKEVSEAVEKGYRMEPPEGCPAPIHALMGSCWEAEPARRPPFRKLAEKLARELRSAGASAPVGGQDADSCPLPRGQEP
ncbi:megakaryocyte-associated tyrosine-protein kinase isoform X10 [Mirounga angustirostris]|uniref:megakaryocyte-associated tyrosine-protein kinase isoform X10 n=1 Tax=Mirounga angustirostris TaxID=9716 RepID=UPI00313B3019